jgi:hypothetical protein
MATYTWSYSMLVNGQTVSFDVVYDDSLASNNITITATAGSLNVNALWFSDGDSTAGEYGTTALAKSDNSLNMNGSGETWDGYQKISSAGLTSTPPDSYIDAAGGHSSFSITADATFLAAFADAGENLTLGVRATSVNGGGSIKAVDDEPDVDDGEVDTVIAVDDDPACGVEGLVPITGNVLDNDTDSLAHDLDITHVNGTALLTLDPTPDGDWYEFAITDGTLKINAETGAFEFTYTGPDLPVGAPDWEGSFTYTITDGDDSNDSPESDHTATVSLCVDAAGASHGYWVNHDFSGSEGFAGAVGATTFDDFFHLDDGPVVDDQAAPRTWVDKTGGGPGLGTPFDDLSFLQAVSFGNGAGGGGDTTAPVIAGAFDDLTREAATAVLNYYDADSSDAFVTAYIYQRNLDDNDGNALNNPTDAVGVLADLKAQVQATFDSAAGAYTVDELAALLHATHE